MFAVGFFEPIHLAILAAIVILGGAYHVYHYYRFLRSQGPPRPPKRPIEIGGSFFVRIGAPPPPEPGQKPLPPPEQHLIRGVVRED